MRRLRFPQPAPSQITPERVYLERRRLLGTALSLAPALLLGCDRDPAAAPAPVAATPPPPDARFAKAAKSPYSTREPLTEYDDITGYNNYYEFGTEKDDPARNARDFVARPWTVEVAGEAEVTGTFDVDALIAPHPLEERIYRLRCVEAWSMVIPWLGIGLRELIARLRPTSRAKYVAFTTLHDPERMPGQRRRVLDWPYREGLRIDEATHPLSMLAVGLYGRELPNQNGAPLRLVVPWKYGYKSIKGIVRIEFVEQQPPTSWNQSAPNEYGFYSNVNPAVKHPRWSQKSERRISQASGIFGSRIATLPFNGYADLVAPMYAGMDLRRFH
ncbi:MAG TPA: protein-methionine-sulfoxide reductase catalytic subunit MsrP [Xanthomonadales bacterium]|nr:protein-methionine-sulfoxide reductase catalytic subunit MsrP [Xanthomonadales bacterium]